jgi:hypothetical protein
MKKTVVLLISSVSIFLATAGAQSLADIASQTRARQKANPQARVIDNDVLPSVNNSTPAPPAEPGSSTATSPDQPDQASASATPEDKPKADKSSEKAQASPNDKKKAEDDQQKKIDDWKKKIADQKKEIAQLQRELDVAEREARLNAAAYYADAGVRLRNQTQYADDSRKKQEEIDSKKQAIEAAKQKLDDLEEQARKDGVPSNQLD